MLTRCRGGVLIVLLGLLATGISQPSCSPKPLNYEREIKKCLFRDYDKSVRPAAETDTIKTLIHMHIRHIDLEEHGNILRIHSWTSWQWADAQLTWNPGDYGNVQTIKILSDDIWQPDVSLMTTGDANMHFSLPTTYCHLTDNGNVYCAPPTTYLGHCSPDLTRWPFDLQTCTVLLGSWTHLASKLNLTLSGTGISTNTMLANRAWELTSSSARVVLSLMGQSDVYPTIEFTFVLRRHSAGDAATAVAPALVLSVTTLLTFLLEPGCSERLTVSATNVLAHVMYLQYMSWRLPANGDSVPALVVFFRDSLVLVGGALLVAIATRRMLRTRSPTPEWLRAAAASLLACAPGQLLLLGSLSPRGSAATAGTAGEDGATLMASNDSVAGGGGGAADGGMARGDGGGVSGDGAWTQPDDTWRLAAVFVDRVSLFVFFIALLALFGRYVS